MEQATRNKLRNVVTQCRKLLEESIAHQLEGQFGIRAGQKDAVQIEDEARMSHLSGEDQQYRRDLLDHLEHIKASSIKSKDALDQLIREIAFTHLNRFCAYKMMEARDVYVGGQKFREAVGRGIKSNGFLMYLGTEGHEEDERLFNTGDQELAYRHFLNWLGGRLSEEIGVLFNPNDPANRLYPRQKTLEKLLDLLNEEELAGIWEQDETIGWVYQYFTPKELRDQARKESQAPRNSYELAFRNQFFTPRYVVEFLTDNTLGRIWYEMRKGHTALKDQCVYMVRRPSEVFLDEGQEPQVSETNGEKLPQEELLKQSVQIAHRPKKDPRDLRVLDPACGSGHFLLYCFDLLLTIYDEAYDDLDLGPRLKAEYSDKSAFTEAVPGLILANNLHGIDIDLRATQIAALALWLRCQRVFQDMGLKKRPKITRSNIVCAEPMPGEKEMLKEFTGDLKPRVLGQLVEVVFDKMKLAGEAGSLLKIEEELRDAITEAKTQWQAAPKEVQLSLFESRKLPKTSNQQLLFDTSGISDNEFWDEVEANVLSSLHDYSTTATSTHRLQRQLFVDDAVRGFAFIDCCQKTFDVILMNPPFGLCSAAIEEGMRAKWGSLANDIYVLFLSVAVNRLAPLGCVGAITSRGFLLGRDQRDFRPQILGDHDETLGLLLDLGLGVLDGAEVETCAFVINRCRSAGARPIQFYDARSIHRDLLDTKTASFVRSSSPIVRDSDRFLKVDQSPILYTASDEELSALSDESCLDPDFGRVTRGLNTSCDERFIRSIWEVAPSAVGNRWKFCAKGSEYLWFFTNISTVIDWLDDGRLIREFTASVSDNVAQSYRSSKFYFLPALTYTYRCNDFSLRALPEGCIFTNAAPVIVAKDEENRNLLYVRLLSAMLSERYERLLTHVSKKGKYDTGRVGKLPVPVEALSNEVNSAWSPLLKYLFRFERSIETSPYFVESASQYSDVPQPDCLRPLLEEFAKASGLAPSTDVIERAIRGFVERYARENSGTSDLVSYLFGVVLGRWDIRLATGQLSDEGVPSPFDRLPKCPPAALSGEGTSGSDYPLVCDSDGLLVDDPEHPDDVVRRIDEALELIWPRNVDDKLSDICVQLGVESIRDFFRKSSKGGFWDHHLKRYSKKPRKAPIYWLLQSSAKNYALWLYYHRLDKDMLFKALLNYVEPKIQREENRLGELRSQKSSDDSGKAAKKLDREIEKQEDLLVELRDFEEKLRKVADLHLVPDLNDGVVLNIAPLHELVPWKEAKKYWNELMDGKYEWSSIGKQLRDKGLVK